MYEDGVLQSVGRSVRPEAMPKAKVTIAMKTFPKDGIIVEHKRQPLTRALRETTHTHRVQISTVLSIQTNRDTYMLSKSHIGQSACGITLPPPVILPTET